MADELLQACEVVVDHLAAVAAEPAAGFAGGEAQDHGAEEALGPPGSLRVEPGLLERGDDGVAHPS